MCALLDRTHSSVDIELASCGGSSFETPTRIPIIDPSVVERPYPSVHPQEDEHASTKAMPTPTENRSGEDNAVSRVMLQAIGEAAKVPLPSGFMTNHLYPSDASPPAPGGLEGREQGEAGKAAPTAPTEEAPAAELAHEPDGLEELAAGRCGAVLLVPRDTRQAAQGGGGGSAEEVVVLREGALVAAALPKGRTVVLPGSYNPLHRGHLGLLEAARAALEKDILDSSTKSSSEATGAAAAAIPSGSSGAAMVHGVFEISVANPDKGGLAAEEVRRRAAQFAEPRGVGWPHPVVVTRAPLFSQKVRDVASESA